MVLHVLVFFTLVSSICLLTILLLFVSLYKLVLILHQSYFANHNLQTYYWFASLCANHTKTTYLLYSYGPQKRHSTEHPSQKTLLSLNFFINLKERIFPPVSTEVKNLKSVSWVTSSITSTDWSPKQTILSFTAPEIIFVKFKSKECVGNSFRFRCPPAIVYLVTIPFKWATSKISYFSTK